MTHPICVKNSDKEEAECTAIECIISTLENVVIEWVSCESCCEWYHSKYIPMLSDKTPEQLNEMIFICTSDLVFWNSILLWSVVFILFLFLFKSWDRSWAATTSNYYCKVPHLRCCSSPRSNSEKSYSECNIPFQLINNCNDLLHFISYLTVLEFGFNNYLELNSYSRTCGLQFKTLFKI